VWLRPKFIRDCTYLDRQSLGVFIGILLGDANFNGRRGTRNIRISFKQSIINFPYMWQVFTMLSHYCSSVPRFECSKLGDKLHGRLVFETRHYPILNQLHDLFIINKVKVIKQDLFHYLTPLALAHWIMCDGVSNQYGLTLCTDGFTVQDVVRLINILIIRYDLNCKLHFYKNKPRIYISANSLTKLRELVGPHIIPFSSYNGCARKKGKRPVI
jgi:hypothetical protein